MKYFFFSIPVDGTSNRNCSWNWEEVNITDANQLTQADIGNRNLKIVSYVTDLPAMKFFQYQV